VFEEHVQLLHVVTRVLIRVELNDTLVLHRLLVHRQGKDCLTHGAADLVLRLVVLKVVIKRHHLIQHFLRDFVERGHDVGSDRYLHIAELPDNWLKFVVVDAIQWLDHLKVVVLFLVFVDRRFNWSEMFLVAEIDVVEKWTFAW
jgi:hypothetical protein